MRSFMMVFKMAPQNGMSLMCPFIQPKVHHGVQIRWSRFRCSNQYQDVARFTRTMIANALDRWGTVGAGNLSTIAGTANHGRLGDVESETWCKSRIGAL